MDIRSVAGTEAENENKRFFCSFYSQWGGVLSPRNHNWVDFTFIHASAEYDKMTGRVSADISLIGFSVTLTYVYDHTFNKKMKARVKEIMADIDGTQTRTD